MEELIKALEEQDTSRALDLAHQLQRQKRKKTPEILGLQAAALKLAGRNKEAMHLLTKALEINPRHPSLRNNKASLLQEMGDTDGAIRELDQLVKDAPNFTQGKENLKRIRELKRRRTLPSSEMRAEGLLRIKNPLIAAFDESEVEVNRKSREENEKKKRSKKLQNKPKLPPLTAGVLAEEWLLAAADALRCGSPVIALELCNYAIRAKAKSGLCYGIAGDAYAALRNSHAAHLCYLIAKETIELGTEQQLNLVTLAREIGDHELSNLRLEGLSRLPDESSLRQRLDKITSRFPADKTCVFFGKEQILRHEGKNQQDNNTPLN